MSCKLFPCYRKNNNNNPNITKNKENDNSHNQFCGYVTILFEKPAKSQIELTPVSFILFSL